MAIAWLLGDQLSSGSTNLNSAGSATPLRYNLSQYIDDDYLTFNAAEPTKLTFGRAGDYLLSASLPMISNHTNTANRNDIAQELRLNGTLIPGGFSDSSYIRNTGGNYESSNRSTTIVLNVQPGDYVEHYVYRGSTETTNTVTDEGHSLYAEYVGGKNMFVARATRTTDSTNLNQFNAFPLMWQTVDRINDAYTHDTGQSETIVLKEPGNYLVYCNIPLETTTQRGNITARVLIDGNLVPGGVFQQGMVRNADGISSGSCHFAGVVMADEPNQELTVTTQLEGPSGTITVGSFYANIIVRKITYDLGVYHALATKVGGGDNWNPTSRTTVDWQTDNLIDTDFYEHSTTTNSDEITIKKPGDYLVTFNVAFQGAVARAVPKATLQVNGVSMPGFQGKSGYVRNSSGADASSDIMVGLLPDLKVNDVITISMEASAANGTINDVSPATLMIRAKNLPVAQAFWFMT